MLAPPRTVVHRAAGIYALERTLQRRGFDLVAGADEAGRGACAGPLVVAAVILPPGRRGEVDELADSKLLTAAARDRVYDAVLARATAWSVVVIEPGEIDRRGLHVCNLAGMRRALATLTPRPDYALTDGFKVDGLGYPGLAVWKGDQVAACVAAASVVAKVTRDRMMAQLHERHPLYRFDVHKGYVTPDHSAALRTHGPCAEHRFSYVNVAAAEAARAGVVTPDVAVRDVAAVGGAQGGVDGARSTRHRGTVGVAPGATAHVPAQKGDNVAMEGGPR